MRVVRSPLAVQRVYEHGEYIARDRPLAAQRWVEGVFAAVEWLKESPLRGREVEAVHRKEIREVAFGGCRIIHRVEAERGIIRTLRHQRQLVGESEREATE